jgi:hypothetical protein
MLRMFRNQPDLSHVKGLDVAESWTKDPVKLKSTLLLKACNGYNNYGPESVRNGAAISRNV